MRLSEIMNQLAYGELSQLSLNGPDNTGILEEKYPIIISSLNVALTKLHTRFPLRTSEVIVQQYIGIDNYVLDSKYALSNTTSTEPVKYIVDTVSDPFINNVLQIERIVNEIGETLWLNNSEEEYSVFTPTYNTIQIPFVSEENEISVIYRADHVRIDPTIVDIDNVEISIPTSHLEPLLYFIASRLHSSSPDLNGNNESNVYLAKYEAACVELERQGLVNQDDPSNYRLIRNGWK